MSPRQGIRAALRSGTHVATFGTAMHQNMNLALLLERTAFRRPDHPAIRHHGETTDYATLRAHAARVTAALLELGVRPDDRVAILAERGVEGAAAFFGVIATGATAVVMNETLRPRQLDHVLEHSGAEIVVTTEGQLALLPAPSSAIRC